MSSPSDSAKNASVFVTLERPVFASAADERRHRLERLAGACRVFGKLGFGDGLLGHLTVRDPEDPELLWVNPLGVSMRKLRVSDLIQVDHHGRTVVGHRPVNPVGLRLHAAVHEARPDVTAVCHAHSVFGKAWSSLGRPLDPITQDSCVFFEQQAVIRDPRVTLDRASAAAFADGLGDNRYAIQVGHGLFTTGETIDEAAWWFVAMDQACQVQLLAEAAGTPERWPDPLARALVGALGSHEFGWMSFQTLWDDIIDSDPDLFD
jgi:ribulose-5-phosphate 4-epimerase/fuculose-1-phosphate aldolase